MSETITPELPDSVVRQARAVAAQTQRPVEAVLVEWIDRSAAEIPIELLSDNEVLALRDQTLSSAEQATLSALLAQQREGELGASQRAQLDGLMLTYHLGMVRKAQALKVAVERGLQPPLSATP